MEKITFKLEVFEGPLELLLHLISKHKLNINDIEISKLLEQYLEYIAEWTAQDLEFAGEFLEMAARLIYIKTVSLLPSEESNEAEENKKDLEDTLIEYSFYKEIAGKLKTVYAGNKIFVRETLKLEKNKKYCGNHQISELTEVYGKLKARKIVAEENTGRKKLDTIVSEKQISVTEKVIYVLKRLKKSGTVNVNELYVGTRSAKVAVFLAILELTKSGSIRISDDNAEIYLSRKKISRK